MGFTRFPEPDTSVPWNPAPDVAHERAYTAMVEEQFGLPPSGLPPVDVADSLRRANARLRRERDQARAERDRLRTQIRIALAEIARQDVDATLAMRPGYCDVTDALAAVETHLVDPEYRPAAT